MDSEKQMYGAESGVNNEQIVHQFATHSLLCIECSAAHRNRLVVLTNDTDFRV
jgi:hypothetical protein